MIRSHKVVCLCGSTKFKAEFLEARRRLTLAGAIVVGPEMYAHSGDDVSPQEKAALDELHVAKIAMSDEVFVLNVGGYVGESTRREIECARALGRTVEFLEPESPVPVREGDVVTLQGSGTHLVVLELKLGGRLALVVPMREYDVAVTAAPVSLLRRVS